MVVTFCGHDFEKEKITNIDLQLHDIIEKLISDGHNCFIISGNGMFDKLAGRNLILLKSNYPHIRICKIRTDESPDPFAPVYSKIRKVKCPKSLALHLCRRRAISEADVVVCYIKTNNSDFNYAIRQEKDIIRVI